MTEKINISISSGTLFKVFVFIAIFFGLFYVRDFIVSLLVAIVLASTMEMPIKRFSKWGIPRSVSVLLIFLILLTFIGTVIFVFIPPLAGDAALFIKTIPKILESVRIFGKDMGFKDLSLSVASLSGDISKGEILTVLKNSLFGTSGFFAATSLVIGNIVNVVLTFVLAFYFALEEHGVRKFLQLVVPKNKEEYITDLWARAQRKIGLWMQGQILLSLLVSLLVYVPMLILGIPYASLLGLLAFMGELVPMVGLTLSTIPAFFLAWTQGGVSLLGIVALIYLIISQVENHVLVPRVMNKLVGVPSIIVIISIVIGARLAGIWGVLLAVPFASILMELAADLRKRKANAE